MKIFDWFYKNNNKNINNDIFSISILPYEPNESIENLVKTEQINNYQWKNSFKFYICKDNIILTKNNEKKKISFKTFTEIIEKENYAKNFNASIYFNVVGKSFFNRLNYFFSYLVCTDKKDDFECITINDQGLSFWCLKTNKNIFKILNESGESTEKLVSAQIVLTKKN